MIVDLIKLILTVPFILVLPGFFLLLAIFGWKNDKLSFFEKAALTVPLSIFSVNFLVMGLDKIHVILNGPVIVGAVVAFCLLGYIVHQFRFGEKTSGKIAEKEKSGNEDFFSFSHWQIIFILVSLFLAIFVRANYFSDTIVPSATDMGHHMFWVQEIIDKGHLPDYGMPDFIIGEHMIFAAVNLVSGASVMGAMPMLILFFVNIVGIFTMAILAGRIFKDQKVIAASFLTAGVLYAINAPQGKYVSGGVIGNVLGNMLIPVSLYFLHRAFSEKDSLFAGLFIFSTAGLLYIHHLSSFILLYSIASFVLLYLILNIRHFFGIIAGWTKIFLKPFPIFLLLLGLVYFLLIFTPSYFNPAAVGQATGEPTKITRVGLGASQLEVNAGSARLILGALGFALVFLTFKKRKYGYVMALSWALVIFLMSWKPAWLYVNIPSNRIGNYLYLPFALLSAYGLSEYIRLFRRSATAFFSTIILFLLLYFAVTDGMADSAEAFKSSPRFQEAVQTFHSARYLSEKLDTSKDILLKDHVNIYGDSWYKLFFMKDYKYPLSRGNLSRYIDPTSPRETCTRDMIMIPETEAGKKCFSETGVNYLALNAQLEGDSFEKYPDFSKVYSSNYIAVFRKNNQ